MIDDGEKEVEVAMLDFDWLFRDRNGFKFLEILN
jgi:hypothetical protein